MLLTGERKHGNAETFVGVKGKRFPHSTKRTELHNPLLRLCKSRRYKAESPHSSYSYYGFAYTMMRKFMRQNDSRIVNC